MSRKHVVRLAICVPLLLVALTSLFIGAAWGKEPYKGEGEKIGLLVGWPDPPPPLEFSSSLPSWVGHGWSDGRYPGSVADSLVLGDGITNTGGIYFELYINGVEVDLKFLTSVTPGKEPGASTKVVHWFVQFPAGYFQPGTYEVTGVWGCRNPNNPLSEEEVRTRELTITP
jgi:hypothetical protein